VDAKRIGIVSNDAGGAQVLSHFVSRNARDFLFSLTGPAQKVFNDNLGKVLSISRAELIQNCDLLLSSTGWSSQNEIKAICEAKKQGTFVIAILDHWVNYTARFVHDEDLVLPDALWVTDSRAFEIATREFDGLEVLEIPNYYLASEIGKIQSLMLSTNQEQDERILFLGENISENALLNYGDELFFGFNEKTSFRYLLNRKLESLKNSTLRIRLHPSEQSPAKYLEILDGSNSDFLKVEISNSTLYEDIAWSTKVFGISSYALYIAFSAGKQAYSCVSKPDYELPFPPESVLKYN
jgi:hypothetical protein